MGQGRKGVKKGQKLRELEALAAIGRAICRTLELEELLEEVLDELLRIVELELGAVYLIEGEEFILKAHRGLSPEFAKAAERNPRDHYILGRVIRSKELLEVHEFASPEAREEGIKRAAYIPLIVQDEPRGVLIAGDRSGRKLTPGELKLLRAVGARLGLALGQAELHRKAVELQERYRTLVENELVGIYIIQEGKLKYVNEGMCRISGYSKEELLEIDLLRLIHPEDRELIRRNIERRVQGEPLAHSYTFRGLRKDGQPLELEIFARRIDHQGRPAIQGVLVDITRLKESEQLRQDLLQIAEEILASSDIEHILRRVVQAVVDHSPFQRAAIALYDLKHEPPLEGPLVKAVAVGLTAEEEERLYQSGGLTPEQRKQAFGATFQVSNSYYIPHDRVPWEPGLGVPGSVSLDGWHPEDFLFIPLRGGRGIIGHISVDDPRIPQAVNVDVLEPMEVFAGLAALAVERAAGMEQLQQHKEWLHGAYQIGQELTRYRTRAELCTGVLEILKQELHYDYGAILLQEGDELVVEAVESSLVGKRIEVGARITVDQGITGWVARHGQPALVNDVTQDSRYVMAHEAIRSELAVPIQVGDELLGVLDVECTTQSRFRIEDQEFLTSVAAQLAVTISEIRGREELQQLSIRDPLTELYNRHYFNEVVEQELERSRRHNHYLTVLMVDLDDFRRVNNVYGHRKGDEVLRELADLLARNVRESDMVFRYGGDEFLILMPETGGEATKAIERLQRAVAEWNGESGLNFHIGISVGVSTWSPEDGRRIEDVLEEADQRMYRAKAIKGRQR